MVTRLADGLLSIRAEDERLQRLVDAVTDEMGVATRLSPELAALRVELVLEAATVERALQDLLLAAGATDYVWVYERDGESGGSRAWMTVRRVRAGGPPVEAAPGAIQPQAVQPDEVAPREVIVRFAAGLSEADISTEIARLQAEVLRALPALRLYRLRIPAEIAVATFLDAQRDNPALQRIEPNPYIRVFQAPQLPNDPYFEAQWGLRRIGVPEAWQVTTGRPEVVIAVIDTGVDFTHPDLQTQLVPGLNVLVPDTPPQDEHGHGTAMAGIIGAAMNNGVGIAGVCPGCRILPIRALDSSGVGTYADVMEGLIYAADHGARVVNLSVGGSVYSEALRDAVDYVRLAGAVVVAAAGNSATDAPVYPAAYPGVLGVAAVDRDDTVWPFSNRGPHVSLAAPGVSIKTTGLRGDYVTVTGTSPATAHASGAAALVASVQPTAQGSQIEDALLRSAEDAGETGRDDWFGYGVLQFDQANLFGPSRIVDIALTRISVTPRTFKTGDVISIAVTIANQGTVSVNIPPVTGTANGRVVATEVRSGALAPGESTTVTMAWVVDVGQDTTELVVEASVSPVESESVLTNNRRVVQSTYDPLASVYVLYKDVPFVHSWIALQAHSILPSGSLKTELSGYLYGFTPSSSTPYAFLFDPAMVWWDQYTVPPSWGGQTTGSALLEGAREEDYGTNAGNHFWNPDAGYDAGMPTQQSNLARAQVLFAQAVASYPNDKSTAYYLLGRVAHLLADLGVPEHVHNDPHFDGWLYLTPNDFSNYEDYTKLSYRDYPGSGAPKDIDTLPLTFPSYGDRPLSYDTELAKLFFNQAEYTQHFDSSDFNGDNQGYGGSTVGFPGLSAQNGTSRKIHDAIFNPGFQNCSPASARVPVDSYNGSAGMDRGTSPTIWWQKLGLTGYYNYMQLFEGPESNATYYVDLARGQGQVALSNPLYSALGLTGQIAISFSYRGAQCSDTVFNFTNLWSPYTDVPDKNVKLQADVLLPENIRYVAALYQLFWKETHPATVPMVAITMPTTASAYVADSTPLALGGMTSISAGVTQVTWVNDRGGSGTAGGTTTWTASVPLQSGVNVITVTAQDAGASTDTDTLTVTYAPSGSSGIACGAPVFADLTASDQDEYGFDGTAGDVVWVSVVATGGGAYFSPLVAVYRPDGSLQTYVHASDAATLSLSQTGRYTLRVYDSGDNPGSYQLRLEWLAPVAKQCTSQTIACGTPVGGSLQMNDQALRGFDGTAGDVVWVSVVATGGGASFDPQVWLYRPDGSLQATMGTYGAQSLPLNQTGRYTLRVDDSGGDPGSYQLRLEWLAPVAKQCTSQTIACGTPVGGSLQMNDQALRGFDGTAGDVVWVSVVATGGGAYFSPLVAVYRPDGSLQTYVYASDAGTLTLSQTGRYTLRVYDSGDNPGSYQLRLEWLAPVAKQCTSQTIACGMPRTGTLAENDQALRGFDGTAGDVVWVSVVATGGGASFDPQVWLYRPDGSLQATMGTYGAQSLPLNQTGRYTLRVDDSGGDPGSYQLRLEWLAPVAKQCTSQTIACGTPVGGSLQMNDQALRGFDGTAGDVVWVSVVATGGGAYFSPLVAVYRPDGSLQTYVYASDAETLTLSQTGRHTLRVYDSGDNPGSYQLRLEWLAPVAKQCASQTIACGTPVTGTLVENDQALRGFDGAIGDVVWVSVTNTAGGTSFDPMVVVYRPDGSLQAYVYASDAETLTLSQTGRHTLRVYDSGGDPGSYHLRLEWLGPAGKPCASQTIACGTPVTGTLVENDQALRGFDGAIGDVVWVSVVGTGGGTPFAPMVAVYRPDGSLQTSVYASDAATLTLSQTGRYTLRVYDSGGDPGSYQLRLEWLAPVAKQCPSQTIACGTPVTGTLVENDQALRGFDGAIGDVVWVSVVGTGGGTPFAPMVAVYRPDGSLQTSVYASDAATLTLSQTGRYTLRVYDSGGDPGSHQLRLEWLAPAGKQCTRQVMGCGIPVTRSLEINDQDLWGFAGAVADKVSVSVVKTAGDMYFNPQVAVYRPDGMIQADVYTSNVATFTLSQAGPYTLRVYDGSGDPGSYQLRLDWLEPVGKPCSVLSLTALAPAFGPTAGGTAVAVTGSGFVSGETTITFGGAPATNVVVISENTATATTPAHAAGVVDVVVTTPRGTVSLPAAFAFSAVGAVRGDFDGDRRTDILWRHTTQGDIWLWPMDGASRTAESYVRTISDTNWEIRAIADFNGDGKADLMWRNKTNGQLYFWPMNGARPQGETYVGTVSTAYDIVASGDFNGDGKADLLWRHLAGGDVWIWLMDGATSVDEVYIDRVDPAYVVMGVADLDADGKADIVFHHQTLGEVWVWPMNGTTRLSQRWVGTVPDTGYQIVGVADHTGDGKADLLWHHATLGEVWIWTMDGTTRSAETWVGTVPDIGYRIAGSGDYNGDGKADILWHHATLGEVWVWLMDGTTKLSETWVGTVSDTGYCIIR